MSRALPGVLIAAAVSVLQATAFDQAVFRSNTQVVSIDVSVTDGKRPVTGLVSSDFKLTDNGKTQDIELAPVASMPTDLTLVVSIALMRVERSTLGGDLNRVLTWLRPQDRLRIVVYARDVTEIVPMRGVAEWAKKDSILDMIEKDDRISAERGDPRLRGGSIFDAIVFALSRPAEPDRRHLVIPLCVPGDAGSTINDGPTLTAVAAHAESLLHVALPWRISDVNPNDSTPDQYVIGALQDAATATGGDLHKITGSSLADLKKVIESYRQAYALRYTLTGMPTGGWHKVDVQLPSHADYQVHARQGYLGR